MSVSDYVMPFTCTGISCRSVHHPISSRTVTTMSDTSEGAWPITAALEARYGLV